MAFLTVPIWALSQAKVQGTISDNNGLPVPGANIVVKGTTNGTTSDFDGIYEITVENFPATLVFSSLGYGTKELQVNGGSTLNVTLEESVMGLDEVVVSGLASSVKRRNLANAVATVSAAELAGVTPPKTLMVHWQGNLLELWLMPIPARPVAVCP